ncbi:MAG TPA: fatty acid--CoA ligase [Pseudomonadales bacterium]
MTLYTAIRTLADVPRFHAGERGDRVALVDGERITTYRDWHRRCSRLANGLIEAGVRPSARIGFLGRNSDAYFDVLFGGAMAGAVLVPVNWRLAPAEVEYIVADSGIEVLFVDTLHAGLIERCEAALASVRRIIAWGGEHARWASWDDWLAAQSDEDPNVPVDPEDAALQIYTSGTTGHPKGVQLPHRAFYALEQARLASEHPDDPTWDWNVWRPEDVSLINMPCFHISGTGWGILGLYNGACNVVLPQFDAGLVLDAIGRYRVTKLIVVPTGIQMLLDHPACASTDFSSLKYFCYGASPIPLDLLKRAVQTFRCGFVQMYGLTETNGAVTFLPAADHDLEGNRRMRSAGRPAAGVEITIKDAAGRDLPPGETGEICIRTPALMLGYWNKPEATAETMTADGWFRSGDAGYLDEDGYVYIQDRYKDMIVSGGVNIYPAEVESAIYGHPDVLEVAVIGVPDPKWGEAVKAIVVPRPDATPDADAILAFARERIAGYKVPKSVAFVDVLPRNASGKILKTELRKPYWEGRERQVN